MQLDRDCRDPGGVAAFLSLNRILTTLAVLCGRVHQTHPTDRRDDGGVTVGVNQVMIVEAKMLEVLSVGGSGYAHKSLKL